MKPSLRASLCVKIRTIRWSARSVLKKLLVLFPALLLGLIPVAHAQVTASISGKVVDATGSGVGGATATVKSLETGATRVVSTDDMGTYRALALPIELHH